MLTAQQVSNVWSYWNFNLKTLSWQYDVAAVSIEPPPVDTTFHPILYLPTPLEGTCPRLDTNEIISSFERTFRDFIYPLAVSGQTKKITDLSQFVCHGYLTLGAAVDSIGNELVAYFPSHPFIEPEWSFINYSKDVEVHCSESGSSIRPNILLSILTRLIADPWRVDLKRLQTDDHHSTVNLHLRFGFPANEQNRLRTAYLSQSLPLSAQCEYIDNLCECQ